MRRWALVHVVLSAYCAGLCAALVWRPGVAGLLGAVSATAGALSALVLAPGVRRRPRVVTALSVGLLTVPFCAAGVVVGHERLTSVAHSTLRRYCGRSVSVVATVIDLPRLSGDRVSLAVRTERIDGIPIREPAHLSLRYGRTVRPDLDPCGTLVEGTRVRLVAAQVEALRPPRRGAFDYRRYLERRGEHVALSAPLEMLHRIGRRAGLQGLVDRLRLASRRHLRAGLSPPVREVLDGMVLGDAEAVDPAIIDDFRRSGLLHIMAVSGENVVLLCSMWSFVLMLFRVPRLARSVILLPGVVAYVLVTGASPSIVRAGVAGVIGIVAGLVSRPSDGWLLWLAPAAWLLTVNPNVLYDVSFQLTFAAVAGLLLLSSHLARLVRFLPGPLAEQVSVTTAASLATAPVSALTFGATSAVAVPANVAGGFVLGPIMFFGMLSLLLGFVSSWLSILLNLMAGVFIGFLLAVAHFFARLPFAVYEWRGLSLALILALAGGGAAFAVWVRAARAGCRVQEYVRHPSRKEPLVIVAASVVALALVFAPASPTVPSQATFTFLDVGEGAASLLQVPHGPTVLIDAGPTPLGAQLRAHGVKRIDLLVLSHGHADHVAGLSDVVGRIKIAAALLPDPPRRSAALDRLERELRKTGTRVLRCRSPLSLVGHDWQLRVAPTHAGGERGNQGENDCALVVVVGLGGQQVLVPGDAEGAVLAALRLPALAVVELPHHGSAGGLDRELIGELRPRLAVVSVGENTFGHPTREMLDLMARSGIPCLRTDVVGDVSLNLTRAGLSVRTARAPP